MMSSVSSFFTLRMRSWSVNSNKSEATDETNRTDEQADSKSQTAKRTRLMDEENNKAFNHRCSLISLSKKSEATANKKETRRMREEADTQREQKHRKCLSSGGRLAVMAHPHCEFCVEIRMRYSRSPLSCGSLTVSSYTSCPRSARLMEGIKFKNGFGLLALSFLSDSRCRSDRFHDSLRLMDPSHSLILRELSPLSWGSLTVSSCTSYTRSAGLIDVIKFKNAFGSFSPCLS